MSSEQALFGRLFSFNRKGWEFRISSVLFSSTGQDTIRLTFSITRMWRNGWVIVAVGSTQGQVNSTPPAYHQGQMIR